VSRVEDWVDAWAQVAAEQLMTAGTATISTSRGTVRATLRRPSWHGSGWLETSSSGDNGVDGSSRTRLSRATDAELRDEICHYLIWQLIDLVGS